MNKGHRGRSQGGRGQQGRDTAQFGRRPHGAYSPQPYTSTSFSQSATIFTALISH